MSFEILKWTRKTSGARKTTALGDKNQYWKEVILRGMEFERESLNARRLTGRS